MHRGIIAPLVVLAACDDMRSVAIDPEVADRSINQLRDLAVSRSSTDGYKPVIAIIEVLLSEQALIGDGPNGFYRFGFEPYSGDVDCTSTMCSFEVYGLDDTFGPNRFAGTSIRNGETETFHMVAETTFASYRSAFTDRWTFDGEVTLTATDVEGTVELLGTRVRGPGTGQISWHSTIEYDVHSLEPYSCPTVGSLHVESTYVEDGSRDAAQGTLEYGPDCLTPALRSATRGDATDGAS